MSAPGRLFEYTNDRCGEAQRDRPGPSQRAASERLVGPLWVGSEPSRPTEAVNGVELSSSREACGCCTPYS